jgi:hypothetical protein
MLDGQFFAEGVMEEIDKEKFLYPYRSYQGEVNLPDLVLDANLQEFSQRVALICALENGGKVTPVEAYKEIKSLWKKLKTSKENLMGSDHY